MGIRRGEITTKIVSDGLIFNIDPANRASTIPNTNTTSVFNTIDMNMTGSIVTDATWTNSTITPSYDFDGSDGYIDISPLTASINTAAIGTISIWARIESNSSYSCLFSGTQSQYRTSFALRLRDSGLPAKLHMSFRKNGEDPSHVAFQTTNTEISADTWYNIAVTQDASAAVCYINGSTVSLENLTSGNPTTVATMWYNYITPTELYIGRNRVANQNNPGAFEGQYWDGQIGPIQFYNRALSAEEVLYNYNGLRGRFGV